MGHWNVKVRHLLAFALGVEMKNGPLQGPIDYKWQNGHKPERRQKGRGLMDQNFIKPTIWTVDLAEVKNSTNAAHSIVA